MNVEIEDANPGASAKELVIARRTAMLEAGLAAQEKKSRNGKDFPSSLSRAGVNAGKTTSSANEKNKDASLPLLHLGTIQPTALLRRVQSPSQFGRIRGMGKISIPLKGGKSSRVCGDKGSKSRCRHKEV